MSAKKRKCGVNAAKIKLGVYRQTEGLPFRQPFLTLLNPSSLVIAVRVSGGHLCEAEAPTEPAGETAARRVAIRFSFKGEADSFTPCAQNDTPFSYHECRKVCAVSCCLVIASTVRCAAIRFSFETPCTNLKYYNKVCTKLTK